MVQVGVVSSSAFDSSFKHPRLTMSSSWAPSVEMVCVLIALSYST